jgi:bifunctional non-homologous end joining protein LigD
MPTHSTVPAKGKPRAAPAKASAEAPRAALPARLTVTHGERVIDAHSGTTKLELVRYYALVGELMMAHLRGRPVSLLRAPSGVGGELFFQKHAQVDRLPGVRQLDQALDPAHAPMLEVGSVGGILSAAQWNVVEFHTQNASARQYQAPDRMVFDLDPGQGVAWGAVCEAAQLVHALLEQLGLPSFLKTSGGKGLHVVVPLKGGRDWDTVKGFSHDVVRHLPARWPARFALKSGAKNRVGKIFIDYLRNGRGATTACAWSARARPGLGISVPLGWDELATLESGEQWSVRNAQARLERGNAPWEGYARAASTLAAAIKTLGAKPG